MRLSLYATQIEICKAGSYTVAAPRVVDAERSREKLGTLAFEQETVG